jgi:hypothetical protein
MFDDYIQYVKNGVSVVAYCRQDMSNGAVYGVPPTNTNYWTQRSYPMGIVDGLRVELNPANFPILNAADFAAYDPLKEYANASYVTYAGSIWFLTVTNGSTIVGKTPALGGGGTLDNGSTYGWGIVTHKLAYFEGLQAFFQITEQNVTYAMSQLSFPNYSATHIYYNNNTVTYDGLHYECTVTTTGLIGVPVTNTYYWRDVVYPILVIDDAQLEASPAQLNALALNPDSYPTYDENTVYSIGDIISFSGSIFECIDDTPTTHPIVGIPLTDKQYWAEVQYPNVYVGDYGLVEANPDLTIFKALNQYDYHKYNNNWLYHVGDYVSYNGNVYKCINVTPPALI